MFLEMSGNKVITTPEEKEMKSMTQKTGRIWGSNTSVQDILNNFQENLDFMAGGNVSFMRMRMRMENKANIDEIQNISRRPYAEAK